MRTEKEIYDLVLNFAFQDERIRIVTLEGSRTNVNIPKDNLQDYDITFFVIDMGEFLKSDDWLSVFGNRIMMQKPEDMELFPPEEKGFSYIMLFDDGVKIDLTLLPVSMLMCGKVTNDNLIDSSHYFRNTDQYEKLMWGFSYISFCLSKHFGESDVFVSFLLTASL